MNDHSTKEKIIEAMYRLTAQKGYDKASIGQISESIGIKKASVYYYFKSKEEIFLQMVRDLYQVPVLGSPKLFEPGISAHLYEEELIAAGEAFIDSYFENPDLRKVYAEIDIQTNRIPALQEIAKLADKAMMDFLLRCMGHGVEVGAFPETFDVVLNAEILFTILIGVDAAILYDLPVRPKAVWREAVLKLFERKGI